MKLPIVDHIDMHEPAAQKAMSCYRVMNPDGSLRKGHDEPAATKEHLLNIYEHMIRFREMDHYFNEAQRQGRISFYMQAAGEEAILFGCAAAMKADDEVFSQYREAGVLMWRGFSVQNFADQCFSNCDDLGKGRQMPVHYGSKALHFHTVSSPLGTQLPQASGAAYALKLEGKGRAVVCFFGDGAASEGDFHAALNFAATLEVPVVFVCRNNGYAISTPIREQYRGDGIAGRGIAYGMRTIRADGNDYFAVFNAMSAAREAAVKHSQPVLLEVMTYREGHHSTSDDSTRYREASEILAWQQNSNPILRLRLYLEARGWWDAARENAAIATEKKAVLAALTSAGSKLKPPARELASDVYDVIPKHLLEQIAEVEAHIAKFPQHYDINKAH